MIINFSGVGKKKKKTANYCITGGRGTVTFLPMTVSKMIRISVYFKVCYLNQPRQELCRKPVNEHSARLLESDF